MAREPPRAQVVEIGRHRAIAENDEGADLEQSIRVRATHDRAFDDARMREEDGLDLER